MTKLHTSIIAKVVSIAKKCKFFFLKNSYYLLKKHTHSEYLIEKVSAFNWFFSSSYFV